MHDHITVVTGPLRSGTSCVTGLLEEAGFHLGGEATRILRRESVANERGHLEPALLVTINHRLIQEVPGGDWNFLNLPDAAAMAELSAQRPKYFGLFIKKFDGELCKDPLMSLQLAAWQRHWPALQRAIFCLRHPLAVARSKQRRYGLPVADGLRLWYEYVSRFLAQDLDMPTYLLDFDQLCRRPETTFSKLLHWLQRPLTDDALRRVVATRFDVELVHTRDPEEADAALPQDIRRLYRELVQRAATAPVSPALPSPND